jgi:hypothetical protein
MKSKLVIWSIGFIAAFALAVVAAAGDAGRSTASPGFYDCESITLLHHDFTDHSAESLLVHNRNVNHIFEALGMTDVVDAVPGDHFNGIWQEVQIEFTNVPGHQYCSDEDIMNDAAAGRIALHYTSEVEICVVVGPHAR